MWVRSRTRGSPWLQTAYILSSLSFSSFRTIHQSIFFFFFFFFTNSSFNLFNKFIPLFNLHTTQMDSFESNTDSTHSNTSQESNHKKRRKIDNLTTDQNSINLMPWRSQSDQNTYSKKLIQALLRINSPETTKPAAGQVRQTADRVLAATAKGRTRWSRAILGKWKKLRRHHKKVKKASTNGLRKSSNNNNNGLKRERIQRLPAVQKKTRVLGRLVPGCRKVPLPNLLEEATDYISALEMQVRAMTALAELLAGGTPAGIAGQVLSWPVRTVYCLGYIAPGVTWFFFLLILFFLLLLVFSFSDSCISCTLYMPFA